MAQRTIEVNGKSYVVGCEDGQEDHLAALARAVDARAREAARDAGSLGETRIMLMAALVLADDLAAAEARAAEAVARATGLEDRLERSDSIALAALEAAAQKIEAMASRQGTASEA